MPRRRELRVDPACRIVWLKCTHVVAICLGLGLSAHLWIGPRTYPATPVLGLLPAIDGIVAQALFAALFVLAGAIIVSSQPHPFIVAFLAIMALFCLLDQTRWQPWVYQYGFLLATLALFSWNSDDSAGRKRTLNVARLIVATTYVFSGLQKLNLNFVNSDFP